MFLFSLWPLYCLLTRTPPPILVQGRSRQPSFKALQATEAAAAAVAKKKKADVEMVVSSSETEESVSEVSSSS